MNKEIIRCEGLTKSYRDGKNLVDVLQGIDFAIYPGDRISILGPSGSGKSTFLHLLGGLDNPTRGNIMINDKDWLSMNEKQRCTTRNTNLGFIYQFHHLLPEFTALENAAMPLLIAGVPVKQAEERAAHILNEVGLSPRTSHKPSQLSGGERQRVAIARALIHQPKCIFADEPTGNLDQNTAAVVFELMLNLNKIHNTSLVIVTHDLSLAKKMDKSMVLHQGRLESA